MNKRLLIISFLLAAFTLTFSQNEDKLSPSTQQFLSELRGEIQLPKINQRRAPQRPADNLRLFHAPKTPFFRRNELVTRRIAEAEPMNGTTVISAFVGVKNNDFSGLEALGVTYQSKFNNLAAVWIPVNKIEEVAALDNVTKIEVAEVLDIANDRQRTTTKAGDAISNSAAAQALGLTKAYTGKDVILGIIDTGIDFTHIAFKDKNGNSRIVRAYKLQSANSEALTTYSSTTQINALTYDTNTEDHGTHTSTTAGGSSVIVSGNTVTVTDNHASATYGGMAPEANLVLAGLSSLYTTSIGTAIKNICDYADQVGKPCVISISLGSQAGPHDGTGTIADIVNQYAGENHIIVYAASNDAMRSEIFEQVGTSGGGGMYATGVSTNSKPMMANMQHSFSDATGNVQLKKENVYAYARTAGVATSLKFVVVDTSNGDVVYESSAYTTGTTIDITQESGLGNYFYTTSSYSNGYNDAGKIRIVRSTTNNKYYWTVYTPLMVSRSYSGSSVVSSQYALCIAVYPTNNSASTTIDMWCNSTNWFGKDLTLSSSGASKYNLVQGSDDCSVSDNACYSKVISVGAYVTRNSVTNYAGTVNSAEDSYPNIGDHASFSSYQTAGYGPLGTPLPHINAPGARIIAGVNHYHTKSVDATYSYYGDNFIGDLVVNSTTSPYAAMEGTSMATPCVSGIIAQWLQACVEKGITPTPDYIKEVMENTWDTDEWTNGTGNGAHGAKTFGTHGKINAIKGLQYILGIAAGPSIEASPENVDFGAQNYVGDTYTQTVTVKGKALEGNITAALSGAGRAAYSIDKTSITKATAEAGTTITITYKPTTTGTHNAVLTLTSTNAESVTINISGTTIKPELIVDPTTITLAAPAEDSASDTFTVLGDNLKGAVTVTLTDPSGVFSINKTSISKADAENGADVTVTFSPSEQGTYTAYVTVVTAGLDAETVSLTGTAGAAWAEVTISKYGVATLYSDIPLEIPYDTYDGLLGVFYGTSYTDTELRLKRLWDTVPANNGIIIEGNSGTYRFPLAKGSVESITNVLQGTLVDIPVSSISGTVMTLGMGSNGYVGFYRYSGDVIPAGKVYIVHTADLQQSKTMSISFEDESEATGVLSLQNKLNQAYGEVYDLSGRKVQNPVRGMYIVDGKKVFIK